jgi:hypothetical protein
VRVEETALHDVHESRRATDEEVGVVADPGEGRDGRVVHEPLLGVQVVHQLEAIRVGGGEGIELVGEDRALSVPVGVDEVDPAVGRRQRDLDQGDDGGDPAAAGEQDQVPRAGGEPEHPGGAGGLDLVAGRQRVVHPVGDQAVGDPLDRDLELVVDAGGRAHRVAAELGLAVDVDPEVQSWPAS